jgi:hypothetical protein
MMGKTPYEILADAHENLVAENVRLRTDIERLQSELARTNHATSESAHLRLSLETERDRAQNAEKLLEIQGKTLSAEAKRNEMLLQSSSWRITAPLRAMAKLLK